ncbi:MAG: biopolymer transporter ExbB [Paracoccaceae bacterium]|nr:MAG: biopolymer transporter ExbB [Paracoccaceae bacterium]
MDKTTATPGASFTQPVRQIVLMLAVIGLVSAGAWLALPQVKEVFGANIWLNGAIGVVFLIGVVACIWQVVQLIYSVSWIEGFAGGRPGIDAADAPRLLAPLASLLAARRSRLQISTTSQRSILDSVAMRIDEARDITRYIVNLLILMGLLGTFYGLATTVPAVVDTIRALAPQEGETGVQVFDKLMGGLEAQLGGMGTAFSSSLLGLAGSLVVGLLELFAGHGQNRFFRELEEWTSTITRIGLAAGDGEGSGDAGAVAGALGDYAGRIEAQMEGLIALAARAEAGRAVLDERILRLAGSVERLAQRIEGETGRDGGLAEVLARIAAAQEAIAAGQEAIAAGQEGIAARLTETPAPDTAGVDAESRMRLRSIDVQLLRILEEISAGRQESVTDLRTDLAALTAAVRQLGRGQGGR